MFFVNQKRHNPNGTWTNTTHVKDTEYEAIHQFHAFMSTYGYGYSEVDDYVACSMEDEHGNQMRVEVDDRMNRNPQAAE